MKRKWPYLLGLAVLLVVTLYVHDRTRAASSLEGAYRARDASEICYSMLADGFKYSGPSGVSTATEEEAFLVWTRISKEASESIKTPTFFGKDRVLAMSIASKQYADLVSTPRGTWLTFTHEIADGRSRLDAAIIAVESEDVSASAKTARQAEAKRAIAVVVKSQSDAREKAAEAERASQEKIEAEREARRKVLTAENLKEIEAQARREEGGQSTAGNIVVSPTPTPLPIELSRPRPTPMLGRR